MSESFEIQVVQLDQALAATEKHAQALLSRVRTLRKRAGAGELAALPALFDQMPAQLDQLTASAQAACGGLIYDTAAALSDGSYLAELQAEARAHGVTLVERDGRLSAFPLLLKLEPRSAGIRIGKALVRRLRPSTVIALLGKAQAETRFDAAKRLNQLFRAYAPLALANQPGWKEDMDGDGPAILLDEIHAILTLLPAAAADYPREAFACDILRLDRAPETQTQSGHRFSFPSSTGSKGRNRLAVFDEDGVERVFVAIRFSRAAP